MARHHTNESSTDKSRILTQDLVVTPASLLSAIPLCPSGVATVARGRKEAAEIIKGHDDRILVIVGPCSIHDTEAAYEYALRLKQLSARLSEDLLVVMRVYLEKPRTTLGWKGLINDPDIDSSFDINKGITLARQLCVKLAQSGIPIACELLGLFSPKFFLDCVSVSAIGARTTESQLHRELASGLPFPIGFKNGTDGSFKTAIEAMQTAAASHHFIDMSEDGHVAVSKTAGNKEGFLVLRGGTNGPNYDREAVRVAREALADNGLIVSLVIDCSHGNSYKNYKNQPTVAEDIADQLRDGDRAIAGVMIESNLQEGTQMINGEAKSSLKKGVSITDGCIDWNTTVVVLEKLAAAVRDRRQRCSGSRSPKQDDQIVSV